MNIEEEIKIINELIKKNDLEQVICVCNKCLLNNSLKILPYKIYAELLLQNYDNVFDVMVDCIIERSLFGHFSEIDYLYIQDKDFNIKHLKPNVFEDAQIAYKNGDYNLALDYLNNKVPNNHIIYSLNYMADGKFIREIILNPDLSKKLNYNYILIYLWFIFLYIPMSKEEHTTFINLYPHLEKIIYLSIINGFENGFFSQEELFNAYDKLFIYDNKIANIIKGIQGFNAGLLSENEAIDCLNNAISKDENIETSCALAFYLRGYINYDMQYYQSAIEDFNIAIMLNPDNSSKIYYNSGLAKYYLEDYTGAIEDYSRALGLNPNGAFLYNNRGECKYEIQDYEGAIKDYNKAIELDANCAVAYNNRGLVRDSIKDYESAIKDYDKAIELDANYTFAYNNRGNSKADIQDYEGAIKDYNKALELDANYAVAYNNRGSARQELLDYENALKDFDKAIELDSNYAFAYFNRGYLKYNLTDYEGSFKDYTKAIEFNDTDAYTGRGNTLIKLGNYKNAIEDYSKAIELNATVADNYFGRGIAKYDLEDYEGAVEDYSKAIALNGNDANIFVNRALCYNELKKYDLAIEDIEVALRISPYHEVAYSARIQYFFDLQNWKEVISYADSYFEKFPEKLLILIFRGIAKYNLEDYVGAIEDFTKVIEAEINIEALLCRGKCYYNMQDVNKALEDFNHIIELEPDNEEARDCIKECLQGLNEQ